MPPVPVVPEGYDPFALDSTRLDAIRAALSKTDEEEILNHLEQVRVALASDVPAIIELEEALLGLSTLGEGVAPYAAELLADSRPAFRRAGARLAGGLGLPLLVPILARTLEDEFWEVQAEAAGALGRIGDRSAVPDLLRWRAELINKPRHPIARTQVAGALLRLGNTSCVSWLLDGVIGDVEKERSRGAQSPVFEGSRATEFLREQSGKNFGFDREAHRKDIEAAALRWCRWWKEWEGFFIPREPTPDRTDPLRLASRIASELKALEGRRYYSQHYGRLLMARVGAIGAAYLIHALYKKDPGDPRDTLAHLRVNACEILRMMIEMKIQPAPDKAELAVHLHRVLLEDSAFAVRAAAARTLACLGDRRSVEPLLDRLRWDENDSAQVECARALESLGFASMVPDLETLLKSPDGPTRPGLRFEVQAALLKARGQSPLDPIVEALEAGLEEGDNDLCEEACTRLGQLTGRWSKVPPLEDREACQKWIGTWKRLARFHTGTLALIEAFKKGDTGELNRLARELDTLLGPEVPARPQDPQALVKYFIGFRGFWCVAGEVRKTLDADELDPAGVLNGGEALAALSGKSNNLHPRAGMKPLNESLREWEAWGEKNAPGSPGKGN
jgi:HEAT repeat protein